MRTLTFGAIVLGLVVAGIVITVHSCEPKRDPVNPVDVPAAVTVPAPATPSTPTPAPAVPDPQQSPDSLPSHGLKNDPAEPNVLKPVSPTPTPQPDSTDNCYLLRVSQRPSHATIKPVSCGKEKVK